jgi:5-methylcytosine-specific restriction endonuclease McrA
MKINFNPHPKPTPKSKPPRKPIPKRKATGEAEMFREVWNERPHICVNCKEHLGSDAMAWFFAHIKSKKKHPELRLNKYNIMLLCLKCHHEYDNGTKESFTKRTKQ